MNKAVLISIRPKWCELIANGKKTIEVRKTAPTIETPFKCYIYCTKFNPGDPDSMINLKWKTSFFMPKGGAVIGEFVCDSIFPLSFYASDASFFDTEPPLPVPGTCLTDKEIAEYLGNGKTGYGWQISKLVIYDVPKELSEFTPCCKFMLDEKQCDYRKVECLNQQDSFTEEDGCNCLNFVRRPPQSWCYVEPQRLEILQF